MNIRESANKESKNDHIVKIEYLPHMRERRRRK